MRSQRIASQLSFTVLLATLALIIAACGKNGPGRESPDGKKTWHFTVVKFEDLQQTEDTEHGLRVGLRDAGLIEGRDFDLSSLSAQGDITTLLSLFDKVSSGGTDLLISLQTTTLHTAVKRVQNIPIVFMVVANPFVITTIGKSDSLHLPFITGVYTNTTFDRMLGYIRQCLPKAKKIGTLFSSLELNATYYKSQLIAAARRHDLIVETMDVSSKTDVPQAMYALCTRGLDAVCQIEDNLTSSTFPVIAQIAQKNRLPVFSFVNEQAHTGSSIVFAPDYYETAKETASTIAQIMKGTSPGAIPFRRVNKFHLIVNKANALACGLTIPQSILAQADSVISMP